MLAWPAARTLGRAALGRRPHQRDLDRIALHMRRRLMRGQSLPAFAMPRVSPRFALAQLRALQLRKLRRTLTYLHRHVPYYGRALGSTGLRGRDIRSLEDLSRLPITFRDDLQSQRDDFISRAPGLSAAVELHTSGTTGRPLELFLTNEELERYTSVQAIAGMVGGFLGPAHVIQMHLLLDASFSARVFMAAALKTGALVLPLGLTGDLDASLESLLRERAIPGKHARVSGLFAAPGFIWALTARAEKLGLARSRSGLQRIFACGAMVSEDLKRRVRDVWGVPLREGYSTVETPATGAYECDRGRMHFLDLSGLVEFLDPETHMPVPAGVPGVAVITAFYPDRELMPLLRYWTDDLMVPSAQTVCECGTASTLIDDILGRAGQMVSVGAFNISPHIMGDTLTAFRELVQPPRYRVAVEEREDAHHLVLDVELSRALDAAVGAELRRRILEALPTSVNPYVRSGTVKQEVRLVAPGGIPDPFGYKLQGPAPRIEPRC